MALKASSVRAGATKIVGLNRTNGTITVNDVSEITGGFADNDYMFRSGDTSAAGFEGMATCTPLAVPTSGDSFRGFDRSVDAEALSGSRIDDTSKYPEEVIGDLAVEIAIIGKKAETAVVFPTVFQAMVKRLRLFRQDTHCIKHMDELVHLIRDDGRPNLRTATTDGLETRARFLGNYIQYDPASHGVASTTAT